MAVKDVLKALEAYVPLFQTLVWGGLILLVVLLLREQLQAFLRAIGMSIEKGGSIKIGNVEIGGQQIVTKTADLGKEVEVFGNPDHFQLLFKANGSTWSKSTKAMEVPGGCVVQVTTKRTNLDGSWTNDEALTFVPGVVIVEDDDGSGRHLGAPVRHQR